MVKRMRKENSPIDKLFYEREMTELGAQYIAGVDEVGRGPFAGPVVCAAVILPLQVTVPTKYSSSKGFKLNRISYVVTVSLAKALLCALILSLVCDITSLLS